MNPYHKPPGPGGGQFAAKGDAGAGGRGRDVLTPRRGKVSAEKKQAILDKATREYKDAILAQTRAELAKRLVNEAAMAAGEPPHPALMAARDYDKAVRAYNAKYPAGRLRSKR